MSESSHVEVRLEVVFKSIIWLFQTNEIGLKNKNFITNYLPL